MKPLTYRDAGVDIDAGDDSVRRIAPLARRTHRAEVLGGIGAFASFVRVPAGFEEPVLEPTRIYVKPVLEVLRRFPVHAMAHVTGGGITGNLPRVLPAGCRAVLQRRSWNVPPVFSALQAAGGVADAEMFRTFNMGIGFVLVVGAAAADDVAATLAASGETVFRLGEIVAGTPGVELGA